MSNEKPKPILTDDQKRVATAGFMFRGSRDFLLAYRLLGRRRADPEVRDGKAPGPFQSWVVCASLALELALKCRIVLDGKPASWTHNYVALFGELTPAAQQDVASRISFTTGPSTAERLIDLLKGFKNPFETFRYLHELITKPQPAEFHEGDMIAVTRAAYLSIIDQREDFRPYQGVIWDPALFDETGMPRWP